MWYDLLSFAYSTFLIQFDAMDYPADDHIPAIEGISAESTIITLNGGPQAIGYICQVLPLFPDHSTENTSI